MDFSNPNAIRQALEHYNQRIAALENQLATSTASVSRPRPLLPDPDKFGGKSYDTWLPLIQAKLDIDGEALGGTEKAHFWYIYGRLEEGIQALVLSLAPTPRPSLIFALLDRIHKDPNKPARASDQLNKLAQGSDSLPRFLARFERTLFEAGALSWPDSAKIATLRAGLSDHLKRKLDNQLAVPAVYDDFVHTLHQLSGRPKSAPLAAPTATHDKMDIGTVGVVPKKMSDLLDEDTEEE